MDVTTTLRELKQEFTEIKDSSITLKDHKPSKESKAGKVEILDDMMPEKINAISSMGALIGSALL